MRLDLVFPRFKLLSGAERAILGLAAALAEAGHEPRIVCHRFDPSCRPRLAEEVELVVTGERLDWTRNRYLNAAFDYLRTLRLRRALDPDADGRILFGPALPLAAYLRRWRRDPRPVVYYCWEPPRVLYQDRRAVLGRLGIWRWPVALALYLYRHLDRHLVRTVDALVTSSPFAARRCETCYGRDAEVVTLGFDAERLDRRRRLSPAPALPGTDPGGRAGEEESVLVTVNYLHPRKRIGLLLEAFDELLGSNGAFHPRLLIVGDGPERELLEARAEELGVADRVTFAGFVDDGELPAVYAAATCYVHTAREESFGLSVVEAAYCGLPVVAVNEGGVRETVVDGVTGFLVDPDPVAVAGGIERVLARADRGADLGAAGRSHVASRYRWEEGAAQLAELVQRIASRGGSSDVGS